MDESGRPVDASGATVSGAKVEGLAGLRALLLDAAGAVSAHRHRKAAGLRARPQARVLRSAGRAQDRPRRGGAATTAGRRSFWGLSKSPAVSDARRGRVDDDVSDRDKSLPRRTVLRGLGATLALPFLDAMLPAFSRRAQAAAKPAHRFQAFYVPNGMAMEYWSPKGEGRAFELSPILEPLAPYREPDARAVGHQGELELHPRRRVRIVSDRHDARRTKRGRDHRRRVDGPAARAGTSPARRRWRRSSCRWMRRPTPARAPAT